VLKVDVADEKGAKPGDPGGDRSASARWHGLANVAGGIAGSARTSSTRPIERIIAARSNQQRPSG
jgi:hypothetical protein